jgi:hypothetical protein
VVDTAKMRRPDFASESSVPSGSVTHDERGNAVWQWAGDVRDVPTALVDAGLSLTGSSASPTDPANVATTPARSGYDPYASGLIEKSKRARKRDLRALSREIEKRKKPPDGAPD